MIGLASIDLCTGCGACMQSCAKGAISMIEDREGFLQPRIDTKLCAECHKCEQTCPIISPIAIPQDFETMAYAAINKDEEIRMQSSSGGVFYALAKWVIEQSGIVFGARWDDKWEVMHDYAEDLEGVKAFMRSKYVQSRVGETYKQAKKFLDEGRWVLYSGTPCQLGGLQAYLGEKDYENLIQIDLLCHGVPSPKVWRKYLRETYKKERILDINMRDKSNGWRSDHIFTTTTTTTTRSMRNLDDIYFRGFVQNVYLRKSCYNDCPFKIVHRAVDITIGDFWGINEIAPELYDRHGVSAIFVHTKRGCDILKQLPGLSLTEMPIEPMIKLNGRLTYSSPLTLRRKNFFALFQILSMKHLTHSIDFDPTMIRVVRKFNKIIQKLKK